MVSLNNPKISPLTDCLIDSDVIINWIAKEIDPTTGHELWKAPHELIVLIEEGRLNAFTSLINIMEVRFVLRRKKGVNENALRETSAKLFKVLKIVVPDEVNLLTANNLQADHPFSANDAVLTAVGLSMGEITLISRDKELLSLASEFLPALTPENFLTKFKLK